MFFGSGSNNFGVQLLLDGFLKHSPAPKSRVMGGIEISPENPAFSGFIFKIQANMDPKHRDRIAFIRVCSGKFERDMTVHHSRSEKKVRLSSSHKLFGNERETVDEALPGDVIGLVGHDSFGIGDTLTTDPKILYKEIPRFTPEAFATCTIRTRPSSNNSARASNSCCRRASSKRFTCAILPSKRHCLRRSARCNSRSCNSGSKANTARAHASNPRRGPSSAGCCRT